MKKQFTNFALSIAALLTLSPVSYAEVDLTQQAAALSKLASPKDENPTATLINAHSIADFRVLLPQELVPVVQNSELSMPAFRSLRSNGPFTDDLWKKLSAEVQKQRASLDSMAAEGFPRAFPFTMSATTAGEATLPAEQRAEQILVNAQAHSASYASYSADFSLAEYGTENGVALRGSVQRIVPKKFRPEDKTEQLFRERFRITSPEGIKGLSWLTFRFFNKGDDVVWVYSPAIKKTRQVMASNRGDLFIDTPLSLDDLFGFSTKIQSVEGTEVSEELLLAPVFSLDALPLRADEPQCFVASYERKVKTNTTQALTVEGGKQTVYGFALHDMNFVPRKLYRVELRQKDPFSEYGRQVLYVDAELALPYYKFVYDRVGSLYKIELTSFALTHTPNGLRAWIPTTTFIRNVAKNSAAVLSYDQVRFCQQADSAITITAFEPKGLDK